MRYVSGMRVQPDETPNLTFDRVLCFLKHLSKTVAIMDLEPPAKVHLHGKGDKWRICPLWNETVKHLRQLLAERRPPVTPTEPVFCARRNVALTRHGIYKLVRRHGASWDTTGADAL